MRITDFYKESVRIGGEFPYCVDIANLPNYHSKSGLICSAFLVNYKDKEPPIILLIKVERFLYLIILRWDAQWDELSPEIRSGEIIYDSRKEIKK